MWCKHFCIIFFDFSGIQTKFIPDYWTKSDDSWDSLDCPNRLSHLRAFPYDYFKIYTIVAIVWMELNSISCPSIWVHLCGVSIIMIIPIVWTVFDMTVMIRTMWTIIWKPGLRKQSGVQVVYLSFVRQYWGKGVLYCVVKGNNVAFKKRSCIITVNCPSVWQLMLHPSLHPRLSQMKPLRSVKYCCSLYNIHFYWCVQTHWCNVFWCCNNSRMSLELKTTVR